MEVEQVDFLSICTQDLPRSRRFYLETLGLPFGKQWGEMPAGEFETGTVTIALGATGASTNRLTVGASAIAPGDTIQRSVDLIDQGTIDLASITLTTSASPTSLLDSDTSNGLQMVLDKCSVAWTESGPPYTYTCSGSTSSVLASRPVIGSTLTLSNLGSLVSGATDHLRVTLTFPSGAGNSLQNQSSTVTYSFTGTQRTATNK